MESPPKNSFFLFLVAAGAIFVLTLAAANSIGFVPYYIDGKGGPLDDLPLVEEITEIAAPIQELVTPLLPTPMPQPMSAPEPAVNPERIIIQEIGLDLEVFNPETRDLAALDEVLKSGPARYVDSARLGEQGNILIFGHSSRLPVVHNQMYKAFNRVPELETGDLVVLHGGGKEYVYRVTGLEQVDAAEGIIELPRVGNKLTLVTCDNLTGKSARFVLSAELIGSYAL
jgi:LPXTG-site transpeptidase (sortase) family protein